jgi:hypothetical protein
MINFNAVPLDVQAWRERRKPSATGVSRRPARATLPCLGPSNNPTAAHSCHKEAGSFFFQQHESHAKGTLSKRTESRLRPPS